MFLFVVWGRKEIKGMWFGLTAESNISSPLRIWEGLNIWDETLWPSTIPNYPNPPHHGKIAQGTSVLSWASPLVFEVK